MNDSIVYWTMLQTLILLVTFALTLIVLFKTRKIHLATYDLLAAGRETKVLFAQLQCLSALERKLKLSEPLPPVRGWVGSPDFLLITANEILERKPRTVMECSSGVSTLVVARCLQINGRGHVYSLEHDSNYAAATKKLLARHGLEEFATVLVAPLHSEVAESPWYSENAIPSDIEPIDILVVDGPPASTAPLARFPALPRLADRMGQRSLVIVDDTDRPDETEMLRRWRSMFPGSVSTDAHCEKGCVMLEFSEGVRSGR